MFVEALRGWQSLICYICPYTEVCLPHQSTEFIITVEYTQATEFILHTKLPKGLSQKSEWESMGSRWYLKFLEWNLPDIERKSLRYGRIQLTTWLQDILLLSIWKDQGSRWSGAHLTVKGAGRAISQPSPFPLTFHPLSSVTLSPHSSPAQTFLSQLTPPGPLNQQS